jgi:hypothetical protein
MAFWNDQNTPEPLRSHRWYVEFTGELKNIKFALKECKKPEYEVNITEHKLLNHYIRLPGILKWKPITIKFASIRDNSNYNKNASSLIYAATKKGGYSNPGSFLYGALSKYSMHDALEKGTLNILQVDAEGKSIEIWSLYNAIITSVNFGSLNYENEDIVNIECTINYDHADLNATSKLSKSGLNTDNSSGTSNEIDMGNVKAKVVYGAGGKDTTQGGDLKPLKFYYPKDPNWYVNKKNPVVVTSPVIPDKEYDRIPPDRFDKAIKLVTAKDANDLNRLIKISRADNRASSRNLSGEYNEFSDKTDGDAGMVFSDTITDTKGNPISTEKQIRDEQFTKERLEREAAISAAEEERRKEQEAAILAEAEKREKEAKWKELTAQQDAKDAASNKDNLASNILQARNAEDQRADRVEYNLTSDLQAEQTTSAGSDFDVDEMMSSEAEAQRKDLEAADAAKKAAEQERQAKYEESMSKLGTLFGLAEQSENDKTEQEETRKEMQDESARLYAEEEIANDDLGTIKANETLSSMQQIPAEEESSFSGETATEDNETPVPETESDYSDTISGNNSSEQAVENQSIAEESGYDLYAGTSLTREDYVSMTQEDVETTQQPKDEVEYGPATPNEEEWEQMRADEKKSNTPNLLGDIDTGINATDAFKDVVVAPNEDITDTGPKGKEAESVSIGKIKSSSATDVYADDFIGSSAPKTVNFDDASSAQSQQKKPSNTYEQTFESEYFFDTRSSNSAGYNSWLSDREKSTAEDLEAYLKGQKDLQNKLLKEKYSEMSKAGRNGEAVDEKYKYPLKTIKEEIKTVENLLEKKKED